MRLSLLGALLISIVSCASQDEAAPVAKDWLSIGDSYNSQHQLAQEKPSTADIKQVIYNKDFHLTIGVGSGWHGLSILEINGDKSASLFTMPPSCQEATVQLSDVDVASLISLLNTEHIGLMSSAYSSDVADGTQWVIFLKSGGVGKPIYLDNYFPDPARKLASWANRLLEEKVTSASEIPKERWEAVNKATWARIPK